MNLSIHSRLIRFVCHSGLFFISLLLLQACSVPVPEPEETKLFNGPIVFTSQIENPTNPACACSGEPTYNQGINLDTVGPTKCEAMHQYPGILQDSGNAMVYLHNGEFFLYAQDLEIPGRGFNWKFERKYRSGIIFDGPLGHNWEFNYNRRLLVKSNGDVLRMDGYTRVDHYTLGADGGYIAPAGYYTQLIKNLDGTYSERDRIGTWVTYSQPNSDGIAHMTRLTDRNNNQMRFEYNAARQLIRVLDTLGRPISYYYSDAGRLIAIEDFIGRTIQFAYSDSGDLITVTSPTITETPNANDFPDGKTTQYRYSVAFADEKLNHNLTEIVAPNEVASAGPPFVKVEYETNPASHHVDRIVRLTRGGVNASAIPAGGTMSFQYRELENADPGDLDTAVFQTTVIDRNGNRTEYQFSQHSAIVQIREFTNRNTRQGDSDFFDTRYTYSRDGEMLRRTNPEGNSVEYVYDDGHHDRFQQGNLLLETQMGDPDRGGDQESIKTSYTYEPIFNQLHSAIDPRGNDPGYVPQNGGPSSPDRYQTIYTFDYQEGENYAALAKELGITEKEVEALLAQANISLGLGDVNGDGRTDQVAGNFVKITFPTVRLLPDAKMAEIEGDTHQPIEGIYAYSTFGQLLRHIDPEGNVDHYDYYPENDPDGDGDNFTADVTDGPFGYLQAITQDAVGNSVRNSKSDPEATQIRTHYFYDSVGNLIKQIDGRGIATEYVFNELNQIVQIIHAADVAEALQNPEEPSWTDCSNPDLLECRSGMIAFRYLANIFYDFNDNVVRREVENRESNNGELAGSFIEYTYAYDILDNRIEETREVSENPREVLTTQHRYDRNENRVLEISPMAVIGNQPGNISSYVYDERDLLLTITRGGLTDQFRQVDAHADIVEPEIPNRQDISTHSRIYDGNRNLIRLVDSADNNGDGVSEVTITLYDGFDRPISTIDAVGNQNSKEYDPASNLTRISNFGPTGGPSPDNNRAATFTQQLSLNLFPQPLLHQAEYKYDEMNRATERATILFDYRDDGVAYVRMPVLEDGPLGGSHDGRVLTRFEYDRSGRRTFIIEDDLDTSQWLYDGADRVIEKIDAEENRLQYFYDDNDNAVRMVEVEITQQDDVRSGHTPDLFETFTTVQVFDSLNRLIRRTDNLGQTSRYHYDSRGLRILVSDAQYSFGDDDLILDPLGLFPPDEGSLWGATRINRPGNTTEFFYDGNSRMISKVYLMRIAGQGQNAIDTRNPANPDGRIAIDYDWDTNDRIIAVADDGSTDGDNNTSTGIIEQDNPKGNVTRYIYDDLNRLRQEVLDDGAVKDFVYDADDNLVQVIDENGSIVSNTYDGINRLVRRDIKRADSSTSHPAYGFKDPNLVWQTIGTTLQKIEYDGLTRLTYSFDDNNPEDPLDDAIVTYKYDSLSRLLEEVQNDYPVSSRWQGDDNRTGLVYPSGRELAISFDRLDRIDLINSRDPTSDLAPVVDYLYIGPTRILERKYGNGVRLTYLDDARQENIGYDGIRRVILHRHVDEDQRTIASYGYAYDRANNIRWEEQPNIAIGHEQYRYDSVYRLTHVTGQEQPVENWQLDGVGNWASRGDEVYQANNMNEYSSVAGQQHYYDDNGNLIDDGVNLYLYDFANRLRRVLHKSDNKLISNYRYDGFGRRIEREVTSTSGFKDHVRYIYDGWQLIEERRANTIQQYVYGLRVDELLTLDRDDDGDGSFDSTFYYHQDGRNHVVALTDGSAGVVERLTYDAYGLSGTGPDSASNPYLFAGRRYDPESDLYYLRFRFYNPNQGRFLQRDPIGVWADAFNLGNGYAYAGNDPINRQDPLGLAGKSISGVKCNECAGGNCAGCMSQWVLTGNNPFLEDGCDWWGSPEWSNLPCGDPPDLGGGGGGGSGGGGDDDDDDDGGTGDDECDEEVYGWICVDGDWCLHTIVENCQCSLYCPQTLCTQTCIFYYLSELGCEYECDPCECGAHAMRYPSLEISVIR